MWVNMNIVCEQMSTEHAEGRMGQWSSRYKIPSQSYAVCAAMGRKDRWEIWDQTEKFNLGILFEDFLRKKMHRYLQKFVFWYKPYELKGRMCFSELITIKGPCFRFQFPSFVYLIRLHEEIAIAGAWGLITESRVQSQKPNIRWHWVLGSDDMGPCQGIHDVNSKRG